MKSLLKSMAPSYVQDYFRNIQNRLANLEASVHRIDSLQATIVVLQATIDEMMLYPRFTPGPGIGFNGQLRRQELFADIISALPFDVIVETGTWTGNTTGFMAESSRLPVFSGELSYRFHSLAAQRLVDFPGITLRHADSRRFLSDLAVEPGMSARFPFFYLDAHWYDDLPLSSEIELIVGNWGEFVIMIDDFQVPGDAGYGYDDYGEGRALTLEYIGPTLKTHGIEAYFPVARSESDTGHQRGCAVLARRGPTSAVLDRLVSLRSV